MADETLVNEENSTTENKAGQPQHSTTVKKVATKKVATKKTAGKKATAKKAKQAEAAKPTRIYPVITVEKCIVIAQKIREKNGGNPWSPKEIGDAIGIRGTQKLFYYTSASRAFGFTSGTNQSKEIALTEFGRSAVYAPNIEIERRKKIEAFLKIEIFKNVLNYYKGSVLPEMKYLSNTLEDKFHLHPSFHEEFSKVFNENCKELNIATGNPLDESSGGSPNPLQPATVVVGEVKKGNKGRLKAFVIMPFIERNDVRAKGFFKEVLDSLLIPAGVEAGFNIETANKQGSDVIQSTIINDLLEADLVIADLTDHNPNVLFELGLRMAHDLPIALIKTKDTGRIFDVDNMLRVYEYNQNLWKSTIESDIPSLVEHFKAAWDNKGSEQSYMKILRRTNYSEVTVVR